MKLNESPTAKTALVVAAAVALLSLSGCGSSAPYSDAPPTPAADAGQASPAASTPAPVSIPAAPATAAAAGTQTADVSPSAPTISIKDFKYQGAQTVSPGATINVTNADIEAHTITADQGPAFDAVIPVGTGTFTAPAKPGTYTYHCNFHGNMKGTLVVK